MAGTGLAVQTETGDDGCPPAARLSEKLFETPAAVAVKIAVSLLLTWPTVALNAAFEAPAVTVTLDGTATLELLVDKLTGNPPEGADPLSATVQDADVGPVTVLGLQERLFKTVPAPPFVIDRLPPVAATGIELPSAALANPETAIGMLLFAVVPETVNVIVATVPVATMFSFNPYKVQTVLPAVLSQATVFASPRTGLARTTLVTVTSEPE